MSKEEEEEEEEKEEEKKKEKEVVVNEVITLVYFISIWSRGMRTLVNFKNPLPISLKPNLGPMSPTLIP